MCVTSSLYAAEEEENLLNALSETTEIATKTKLNVDFTPGLVTVLYGNDLELRGVRTLGEAMETIAGITYSRTNDAAIFRGTVALASGKVKYLLNGLPMNNDVSGYADYLTKLPIEIIDRIEVIRGPASAIYGEYSFSGTVNVITKTDGNKVFASGGSFSSLGSGGIYNYKGDKVEVSAILTRSTTHDNDEIIERDGGYGTPFTLAPGSASFLTNTGNMHLSATYNKNTSFLINYNFTELGETFGLGGYLSPNNEENAINPKQLNLELRHKQGDFRLKVGALFHQQNLINRMIAPTGLIFPQQPLIISASTTEEKYYTGLEYTSDYFTDHKLLFGIEGSKARLVNTSSSGNLDIATFTPLPVMKDTGREYLWLMEDKAKRDNVAFYFQDEYKITSNLSSVFGFRFDHYDDVGHAFSPRVAVVYNIDGTNLIKTQVSTAFRPPTFYEMYSNNFVVKNNPSIRPETIRMAEIGYIHKKKGNTSKVNIFTYDIEDLISLESNAVLNQQKFVNTGNLTARGIEFETERVLTDRVKLLANFSYIDTDNYPGSIKYLSNVDTVHNLVDDYFFNVRFRYIGTVARESGDSRDKVDDTLTVNVTGTKQNFLVPNLRFQLGVNNVFDTDIREAAPTSYYYDYPQAGRTFWGKLSYDF